MATYIVGMKSELAQRRAAKKAEREASAARLATIRSEAVAVVVSGVCPDCGAGLHRNSSLSGWYQCNRSGSGSFRLDNTGTHCSFQCFTE